MDPRSQQARPEENQRTSRSAIPGMAYQLQRRNSIPGSGGGKGADPGSIAQGVWIRKDPAGKGA